MAMHLSRRRFIAGAGVCGCGVWPAPSAAEKTPPVPSSVRWACAGASEPNFNCVDSYGPAKPEALAVFDWIIDGVGVTRNFEILSGEFSGGCIALAGVSGGKRYIVYDDAEFGWGDGRVYWYEIGIAAHEVGHLLMSHWLDGLGSRPYKELQADMFAGRAVARLGGSLAQALSWSTLVSEQGSSSHPPRADRIEAVALGWGRERIRDRTGADVGRSRWIGDTFEMAGRSCRLARTTVSGKPEVRLACESRDGRWVWKD